MKPKMSILDRVQQEVRRIQKKPGLRRVALALPDLDREVWRHGRAWLVAHGAVGSEAVSNSAPEGPDVYLATHLYIGGGHTALIGDFVRARRGRSPSPRLFVTNVSLPTPTVMNAEICARTGIPDSSTVVFTEGSLDERLELLFRLLLELRPGRLFLFHHSDDPLAVAVAQSEVCRQCVLVHHTDAKPTLGLHTPGISIIEINPWAAATSRAQRLAPELLLLTCPDPGPRPHGFRLSNGLVTATSGSSGKFTRDHHYTYAEAVAIILRATRGQHVHIGPLDTNALAEIDSAMRRADLKPDRFVHRDWVPSVAAALWEHGCDVYVASFPTDGARAMIEVAASGTPYLAYTSRRPRATERYLLSLPGTTKWSTWEELEAALVALSDNAVLDEKSRLIREGYLRRHQPPVFQAMLESILAGGGGLVDPDATLRDQSMLSFIVQGLTKELPGDNTQSREDFAVLQRTLQTQAGHNRAEGDNAIAGVERRFAQLVDEKLSAALKDNAKAPSREDFAVLERALETQAGQIRGESAKAIVGVETRFAQLVEEKLSATLKDNAKLAKKNELLARKFRRLKAELRDKSRWSLLQRLGLSKT